MDHSCHQRANVINPTITGYLIAHKTLERLFISTFEGKQLTFLVSWFAPAQQKHFEVKMTEN